MDKVNGREAAGYRPNMLLTKMRLPREMWILVLLLLSILLWAGLLLLIF